MKPTIYNMIIKIQNWRNGNGRKHINTTSHYEVQWHSAFTYFILFTVIICLQYFFINFSRVDVLRPTSQRPESWEAGAEPTTSWPTNEAVAAYNSSYDSLYAILWKMLNPIVNFKQRVVTFDGEFFIMSGLYSDYLEYDFSFIHTQFLVMAGLAGILYGLSKVLSKKVFNLSKKSAYECGFEPFLILTTFIEISFILVAFVFLIFDLELIFLSAFVVSPGTIGSFGIVLVLFYLSTVWAMVFFEMSTGVLSWPVWTYYDSFDEAEDLSEEPILEPEEVVEEFDMEKEWGYNRDDYAEEELLDLFWNNNHVGGEFASLLDYVDELTKDEPSCQVFDPLLVYLAENPQISLFPEDMTLDDLYFPNNAPYPDLDPEATLDIYTSLGELYAGELEDPRLKLIPYSSLSARELKETYFPGFSEEEIEVCKIQWATFENSTEVDEYGEPVSPAGTNLIPVSINGKVFVADFKEDIWVRFDREIHKQL